MSFPLHAPRTAPLAAALAGLRPGLAGAAGVSAILSLLMLTGSIYMLQVYDRVLSSGSVPTLLVLFGLVIVLHGFMAFYDALRMRLMSRLALGLDESLAPLAFRADLGADPGTNAAAGGATRDLDALRAALSGPAVLALFDLPFTVLFLAVLFTIHPLLGWLTVGGMALAATLALVNRAVTAAPMAAGLGIEAQERSLAERARRAAPALGALGMGGAVTLRWLALHRAGLAANQRGGEPSETLSAASRALRMLLQSALLTAGAWLVLQGAISAGAIIASSILAGRALAPVDALIGQWRGLARGLAAHRRLGPALAAAAAQPAPMALPAPTGRIAVQGLTRLAPARPAPNSAGQADRTRLLDGLTFALEPGAGLGIIGASASGKSTLARLLVGAAQPDAGEIRLDGATPGQWDPDILGRHIGYLPQQVELLPGSVRDNIARFDPAASDEAVIAAAEAAGVHAMILGLPDGYATDLGQAEMPLSGGQIQRVALARALYGDPRILVLDEPNAHLDIAGEAALTRALMARRAAGATVIVMAHRAGALAAVDRLMVLERGRLVQDGPRDTVLSLIGAGPGAGSRPALPAPDSSPAPAPLVIRLLPPAAPQGIRAENGAEDGAEQATGRFRIVEARQGETRQATGTDGLPAGLMTAMLAPADSRAAARARPSLFRGARGRL